MKKSSIALIVPCYNESESIQSFGAELLEFINEFKTRRPDFLLSIIIVDNNSTDNSLLLLADLQNKSNCIRIESCRSRGYGAALKHGFSLASSDYLCFLDLDNTYPLVSLFDMLNQLQQNGLDIVYGARIHHSSDISVIRSLGNRFYVLLLKILFNSRLSDVCSGMRVFKGSLKDSVVALKSNGLSFSIEFTSHALKSGWNISELPILYRYRTGQSKLSVVADGFAFLWVIIANFLKKKSKNV